MEIREFMEKVENILTGMNTVIMVLSKRWTGVTKQ